MNYLAPLSLSFFIHIGLILSFSNIFSIDIKSLSLYEIDPIPAYIIYEKPKKQIKKKILSIPKETLAEPKKKIEKIIISEPSIELEEISRSSQIPAKNFNKDVISFSQSDISKYSSIIKQQVMSQWKKPRVITADLTTEIRITLVPTGEIVATKIIKGSGIKSFDDSAITAIARVGSFEGLQMPSNLFEEHFRQFILVFNPN
jgi:colicin import membrane protein|tara:strand:- start:2511 stop:3116 length:606 start_codon:yes stop_codon:yes gene_type:complete